MTTRIADTHDPDVNVTLDSGSHINARYQPRPKAGGWMPEFDRRVDLQRRPSNSSTVSPTSRDLAKQCRRNIAATVKWYGRAAAIRVSVLAMGPALTSLNEAQSFKQRRNLAWLENGQRARHYAT